MAPELKNLRIKIFADGADLPGMLEMHRLPYVKGFTTNPTLMRKAGVGDYKDFALKVLNAITDRPVSFEVFADDADAMEVQAMEIASWGPNVNVKIPITNTKGESMAPLVGRLSRKGVQVNITAMFTLDHVTRIVEVLDPETPAILSLFAGRIADTGRDPVPIMREAVRSAAHKPKAEILWASPRELLNVFHAEEAGCHIITVTSDVLKKLASIGKSLDQFSIETVRMFHDDANAAKFDIPITRPGT